MTRRCHGTIAHSVSAGAARPVGERGRGSARLARWMTPPGSAVRSSPVVRALATSALFVASWSFLHVWFFQHEYAQEAGEDVVLYQSYGDAMKDGDVPYRDFAVVYPPGALPVFVAPAPADDYNCVFEAEMLLCGLALAFLVGLATSWWPWACSVGLAPVLVGDLMQTRYDLWPALLTAGTMLALLRDRHRLGWALLGAAVIAKGYAICLVPLAAFWTARRAGRPELLRAAAWGAGVAAVVLVPFLALAPHGTWGELPGPVRAAPADREPRRRDPDDREARGGRVHLRLAQHPRPPRPAPGRRVRGGRARGAPLVLVAVRARRRRGGSLLAGTPRRSVTAFVAFGKVLRRST